MKLSHRGIFWAILGSFFVSGAAGLIYQVVWTRYLALFLGHTSYAVVAVLVAFMGGLALGNAWLGTRIDRLERPLFFYALLELGIGMYAVVFPSYYPFIHGAYLSVVRSFGVTGGALLTIKFLFACLAILPPTVLMGATLPALAKYVTRSLSELRGKVAALYAINSSGAVLGALLADWWWIPSLGLEAVTYAGATMSLMIGLVALILSAKSEEGGSAGVAISPPATSGVVEQFTATELRLALIGIGISGFVAMLYEVAWTRLLGLSLGSSTHAYSLMLVTFIAGIAVGGWVIYRWKRQAHTLAAFAWAELALAGTLFVSLLLYDLLPWVFANVASNLSRRPGSYPWYEVIQASVCFAVMFVPAVCLGMTLPLASRVATAELSKTGRSVGLVFAVNTLGTVLGAAVTGLVLLPHLGLPRTFALGIGLNAFVGMVILGHWSKSRKWLWVGAAPAAMLVLAWVIGTALTPRWQRALCMGLWRSQSIPSTVAGYRALLSERQLLYYRDGAGSSVAVTQATEPDNTTLIALRVNGKVDASTGRDMPTQLLAGHLPILLRPDSAEALVVGCGSGVTAGALLRHPTIQRVDLVEISPEVIEVAGTFFAEANQNSLKDPRLHVAVEDAKSFLKTTTRQYDVIATEPSNPWMAGVSGVFSREYYEDCKARLKPDGLIAQWLQVYETDEATFDMVVATFGSVFPFLSVWQTASGDLLLVGAMQPVPIDLERTAARIRHESVARDLGRVGLTRLSSILALQHVAFGDGVFLPQDGTPLHSDFYPKLEYAAERAFFVRDNTYKHIYLSELLSPRPRTLWTEWTRKHPLTADDCAEISGFFSKYRIMGDDLGRTVVYRWLALQPNAAPALRELGKLAASSQGGDAEVSRLAERPEYKSEEVLRDIGILRLYSGLRLLSHRGQRSAFYLPPMRETEAYVRVAMNLDTRYQRLHRLRLAELLWDRGEEEQFLKQAQEAFDPDPKFGPADIPELREAALMVFTRIFDTLTRRGDWAGAVGWWRAAERQGYLQPKPGERSYRFELYSRMVGAAANSDAALTAPGAPDPAGKQ